MLPKNIKSNWFICRLLAVCFGLLGIAIGAFEIIQRHTYIDKGIVDIDNYQSLGIDMGLMGCFIGLISALFGMVVHKLKYLSV